MKKIRNSSFILDATAKPNCKDIIKMSLKNIKRLGYSLKYRMIRVIPQNTKYNVSICSIFKNEAPYLKEWIEFNHIIGVEHFYLYNNNSNDDYMSVLEPYINSGLVTLYQWPKNQAQMECYYDCIVKHKNDTKWIGFIDIDEFIVPIEMNSIYDFLRPFEKRYGAVKVYWKMFGTSGLLERDMNTLVTESFIVSWPKYYSVGKCFYNTSFGFDFHDPRNACLHHMFWVDYKGSSMPPVNPFKKVCLFGSDMAKSEVHPIQINHYFTKSYKEYAIKKSKGDVYFEINPHDEEYFFLHECENTSVDYSVYKYLIKLKLQMERT